MSAGDPLKAELADDAGAFRAGGPEDPDTVAGETGADSAPGAADAGPAGRVSAKKQTGKHAMAKLGHAIDSIAERIDDLEDHADDSAFAGTAVQADPGVAPYIANAERELRAAKDGDALDIFERIAQAAEEQYDERRGRKTVQETTELVDDRRVGTKRWTPSKTVKKRMEKLEAARRAQEEARQSPPATADPVSEPTAEPEGSAETLENTTTETVAAAAQPTSEPAPADDEERVVISRRGRQASAEEGGQTDAAPETDEDDDAALRVVPGIRGRRRDRARKSRLDEDFEKIFEDDGKPSIGNLRRKLRSGVGSDEEAIAAQQGERSRTAKDDQRPDTAVTEETFGAEAPPAKKPGLLAALGGFSLAGLLTKKSAKPAAAPAKPAAEDDAEALDLVRAFEDDREHDDEDLLIEGDETVDDDAWEEVARTEERQRQITTPILVIGICIAAAATGYFIWAKFLGG